MRTRDSLETDTRVVDVRCPVMIPRRRRSSRREAEVLDDPERRREESAESRQRVEGDWDERPFKVDREELGRFDLKRAGLPDMSIESAAKYIEEHRASRPWLAMTDRASPEARRIIAALDAAGGHAHIRHEGWVTEEANRRRVAYHEDPAQLDPEKRTLSIDGLRPDGSPHRCRTTATRITDPDAFATAFVRGVEHPKVREALDMPFNPARQARSGGDTDRGTAWSGWLPLLHRMAAGAGGRQHEGRGREARRLGRDEIRRAHTRRSASRAAAPVPTFKDGDIVFDFMRER